MNFEQHYEALLEYARSLCNSDGRVDASDLVHESYIELHDKEVDLITYKRKIKGIYLHCTHDNDSRNAIIYDTERVCLKCKQLKPIQLFYNISTGGHIIKNQVTSFCKECLKKYNNSFQKQPVQKEKNKKRVAKYVKNNRDKWNAYMRERYKLNGRKDRKTKSS